MKKLIFFACSMFAFFTVGGTIGWFVLQSNKPREYANPAQFRAPALEQNQTLVPSFDLGVIAGDKQLTATPNASEAKIIEASIGQSTTITQAVTKTQASPRRTTVTQRNNTESADGYQSAAPKKASSSTKLLDDLM